MSDRQTEMARLHVEQGLTYQEIANMHGITRQRVSQILGPLQLKHPPRGYQPGEIEEIEERLRSGESTLKEEAARLGKDPETLRTALWRRGYKDFPRRMAEHGTVARYSRGCHCEQCRAANRRKTSSYLGKEPPNHGTNSGYSNYQCKCQPCLEAGRAYQRKRRRLKRNRREVET